MNRPRRSLLPWAAAAALLPALALTAGSGAAVRLSREVSLRAEPDGALSAFLPAGTPLQTLEERPGWTRVRLEGWIPSDALVVTEAAGAAAAAAAPTPSPVQATAEVAAPASGLVEGILALKRGRFRTREGKGVAVYLWPGEPPAAMLAEDPDSVQRLAEIQSQADDLQRRAELAMRKDNFTEATQEHDRLMAERARTLRQGLDIMAARHGRHEAEARRLATATAVGDARGWFSMPPLPPGSYTVYARMLDDDFDLEWIEEVRLSAGVTRLDLGRDNARGLGAD